MDEKSQPAVEFTDIIGFYNGNSYPIQLSISDLAINIQLAPRAYFEGLDTEGRKIKINDPRLMAYTGKSRLSCERVVGKQFPIYRIGNRNEQGRYPVFLSTMASTSVQNSSGQPVPTVPDLTAQRQTPLPTAPRSPIRAYPNMADAIRAGVATRPRERVIKAPTETAGAPLPGHTIPEMQYNDGDVANQPSISESLRMPSVKLDTQSGQSTPATPVLAPLTVEPVVVPPLNVPTFEDILEESSSAPVPADSLQPGSVQPTEPVTLPFVCSVCQSADTRYQFRSQLERHAKHKHPDSVESVMAPYPRKSLNPGV